MLDFKNVREEFLNIASNNDVDNSDVDWIFCYTLNKDRSNLKLVKEISDLEYKFAKKILNKRIKGFPIDQIIHESNFYGLKFYVNKNVLIPRPETELLVEQIIKNVKKSSNGLDIGTGSGVIAISLNKLANMNMCACDISNKALSVAKKNNKILSTSVKFLKSDLYLKVNGKFDFIVSNPPYIKSEDINSLQREVKDHEPRLALDGKEDGLYFYRKIIEDAPKHLKKDGMIFFELGEGQSNDVKAMLEENFKDIVIVKDYSKIDRIIYAVKR